MIEQNHLIIFSRYPESGKTKTRMIPALGAEGAAQLQRHLTQHTIAQINSLKAIAPQIKTNLRTTLQFSGGTAEQMQQWLGPRFDYRSQHGADLGDRLISAFHTAFAAGASQVVTIGTDCPSLEADILRQAFEALQSADLVLGPAVDGGYYLIGLRREVPDLFVGIDWGTERVFEQTMAIARSLNLCVATLETLPDIDRPDDLAIWENIRRQTISIILPVLNESGNIAAQLEALPIAPDLEVIVVDGGSQDNTVEVAQCFDVAVLTATPGRAHQMNRGAAYARGGILLFLHADTRLPPNFAELIRQTLAKPGIVAGAFDLQIDGNAPALRLVEWGVKWRSHLLQLPYGDQAIFLKAEQFHAVGGFPKLPIMEDFVLVQRLRPLGKVAIAPAKVVTSARRWQKLGVWRTTLLNQAIILGYYLGVSPEQLARWYRSNPPKKR